MSALSLTLCVALAAAVFKLVAQWQTLYEMRTRLVHAEHRNLRLRPLEEEILEYRRVLGVTLVTQGGVGKRIKECREITAAIHQSAPDLFVKEEGLIHWLSATDQFLTELRAAQIAAQANVEQEPSAIDPSIYRKISSRLPTSMVPL
ncbi:hypothetical protein SRS16P2_00494 (plasmid) [Variovorax sp. SRS16]|uniref:hypothetical protein n=1 Tax=Variovorax sp. SRS16 TaxID=282217 RepID=UPI0013174581|nr:hypothetical protein [Variovorax sp. SRS16]VTU46119.1 hypothetical protein SRS16P2_00494 [Variovorax sp. SRS16]